MVWIEFILSAVLITLASTQLAKYGDIIAIRTRLNGMFIGVLLLAGATSLPEMLTSISALNQGTPNLAAGNLFGSSTINMLILAIVGMLHIKRRILRKAAFKHSLTGSIAVFLIGLSVYFIMADIPLKIGWVGIDSLIIIAFYIIGVRLIKNNNSHNLDIPVEKEIPQGTPALWKGVVGFCIAAGALVLITPVMVRSANGIATITGMGTTFIGTVLVALVTSLPELVTTIAAVRIGADDMAIGNLFGSNMFNIFVLGLTDLFYTQGRFLAVIDPSFLLVGMTGLLMTGMGLIGNLAKLEKRIFIFEMDSVALVLIYIASLWLLYNR
ncbi:MAG: sodium:calcium antiporter [Anaerolineaceae bacterium]